jgi:hypothetical protein
MAHGFLLSLSQVLEYGLNTNSYKFVLARALADDDLPREPVIPAPWLANKFLELYWPLATHFRVRQSTDPTREPVAYKAALQLAADLDLPPGRSLGSVRATQPERVQRLVGRLATKGGCLDEVVPRFNLVRRAPVPAPLFHPDVDERSLILARGAAEWISANRLTVRQLANGAWVRFTETFSVAPRLYQKLAGEGVRRASLAAYGDLLARFDRRCFHCGREDAGSYEVDHFLPWSFVLEDRIWNLVLACGGPTGCNQRKRDGIPSDAALDRLCSRNEDWFLAKARIDPRTCHAHIREWLHRDLAMHLRQLRTTALAEGFPPWGAGYGARLPEAI